MCNGCQLLALLGWVGEGEDGAGKRKRHRKPWTCCLKNTNNKKNNTIVVNSDDVTAINEQSHHKGHSVNLSLKGFLILSQTLKWC